MKRFLTALIVLVMMTAQVEATPFTRSQLDNIFMNVEQSENSATFELNADTFKEKFNGIMIPILKKAMETNDVSEVEYLFLIKDYKVIGNVFANMFGDYRVMIAADCAETGNFKTLNFCFTTPEEKDESLFTILLLSAFVNSIAPDIDPKTLIDELTAENAPGEVVKGNIKFSISADGNLNILTATPNQ